MLQRLWLELKQELNQVADEAVKSLNILDRILAIWLLCSFFIGMPLILVGYLVQSGDLLAYGFGTWILGWPWVIRDGWSKLKKRLSKHD